MLWGREKEGSGCKSWRRGLGNLRGKPLAAVAAAEGRGPDPLDCCCSRPGGSPWASVAGT